MCKDCIHLIEVGPKRLLGKCRIKGTVVLEQNGCQYEEKRKEEVKTDGDKEV